VSERGLTRLTRVILNRNGQKSEPKC
jgi:hypothetical protein